MKMRASSDIFLFEEFRLDRVGGGLFRRDDHGAFVPVGIGSRALDILAALIERRGEIVSKEKIMAAGGTVSLTEVLPEITSRRGLITAFLAILELTRLQAIHLKQDKPFGEITARANPDYELSKSFSPA